MLLDLDLHPYYIGTSKHSSSVMPPTSAVVTYTLCGLSLLSCCGWGMELGKHVG